jgi:NTP pyrophosphatase (non-canonical NTP hydrolase)
VDQDEEPQGQLLRQVMSDVEELVAQHRWETAPRRRMAFLLGEAVELAEEILRLPEAGPYEVADRQRVADLGQERCESVLVDGLGAFGATG